MHHVLALLTIALGLCAQSVQITVLATSDMHGHLLPYDYYAAKPADRGLARLATIVDRTRKENPNTLLIDCGDTIQGSPLESVYQAAVRAGRETRPDPMMLAMNAAGYDAMVLGNHEFNFGLPNLLSARKSARFPWLSANTRVKPGAAVPAFEPYILRRVAGVKVAVVGITTPAIPMWEKPENYAGYEFQPGLEEARRIVERLKRTEQPDLVILAVHAGIEREADAPGEGMVHSLARGVPGIDAIVFGHTHQEVPEQTVNRVLITQPKNFAISIARLDFGMERAGGRWRVRFQRSRLIPAGRDVPPDPRIVELARPYHEAAERYLTQAVAEAPAALDATLARVQDTALIDAIQAVQLHYSQADVSFASSFRNALQVRPGPVTVRELAALYLYDNELFVIQGSGRMVKDALENSARYFRTCPDPACSGPLVDPRVMGFNFDMAQGVEYEIDLRHPAGSRVLNLRWKGKTLDPDQPLRIAINNYRAAGSAGYGMFRGANILWRSGTEIRDLMIEYYTKTGRLPATPDNNWRILPPEALQTLTRELRAERSSLQ